MKIDAVQTIKQSITMFDVVSKYGLDLHKKHFIYCPFHNEKTPSMKIYTGQKGYYCFGCGTNGDVVSFVQKFFNLSFPETLKKIDVDFCLNIYSDHSFDELKKAHYRQKSVKAQQERIKREKELIDMQYWKAFDEWKRLSDNRKRYAPKSDQEPLHPLFVESLQKLSHQEYKLDCLEEKRRNYA